MDRMQRDQDDASSSSSSTSSASSTSSSSAGQLSGIKRPRTAVDQLPEPAASSARRAAGPAPTPDVVILEFIELPALLVVQIVHMLDFRELAVLDTTCRAFHPTAGAATEGLTQLSAQMRAQWALKPWQMAMVPRPKTMGWARWLVDVRWRERVVRAGGRLACGGDDDKQHLLVVCKNGAVMSCGYDAEHGERHNCPQLGHSEEPKCQRALKRIQALAGTASVQVSAGRFHSLALTESGNILSFGYGDCGGLAIPGLGHGDREEQHQPKLVEALKGKAVAQVSTGGHHSLVLTKDGQVFASGWAGFGQLGHGDRERQHLPKLVEALKGKKVVQVSAGRNHSLVLMENGDVFSAGQYPENGHGTVQQQLLLHRFRDAGRPFERKDCNTMTQVATLKGKKVVQISAGGDFSLVLTGKGDVFSFGKGNHGQLGHGNYVRQCLPKLIEALKGKKVVQVSAGGYHSLVLTESGDVYSFGKGGCGSLGHGDKENQSLPKLVVKLKNKGKAKGKAKAKTKRKRKRMRIVTVAAGHNQSAVLTEDECILVSGVTFQTANAEWDEGLAYPEGYDPSVEPSDEYDVPKYFEEMSLGFEFEHELLPQEEKGE